MSFAETHWHALVVAAAIAVLAAGGVFLWWRHRPRDPEEIERRRRSYVNRIGRIVEGQILEIVDRPAPQKTASRRPLRNKAAAPGPAVNGARKLVCYSYAISSVTYETAQDVTDLEERACLGKVISGQAASVKYDPSNPSNSILIAEDWSGLR